MGQLERRESLKRHLKSSIYTLDIFTQASGLALGQSIVQPSTWLQTEL